MNRHLVEAAPRPRRDVTLCECFARDGLQHEEKFIDTGSGRTEAAA